MLWNEIQYFECFSGRPSQCFATFSHRNWFRVAASAIFSHVAPLSGAGSIAGSPRERQRVKGRHQTIHFCWQVTETVNSESSGISLTAQSVINREESAIWRKNQEPGIGSPVIAAFVSAAHDQRSSREKRNDSSADCVDRREVRWWYLSLDDCFMAV